MTVKNMAIATEMYCDECGAIRHYICCNVWEYINK